MKALLSAACLFGVAAALPPAPDPLPAGPHFRDVAAEVGLDFHHVTGAGGEYYLPEILGSGCALLDYDGDGDLDALFQQGGSLDGTPSSPGPRLFRNDLRPGGRLRFTDVTAASGLRATGYGMGVATGDADNDGDVDLYLTGLGGNALYRNDGGTFTDVTAAAGAGDERWTTSASFVDYDRDGDLDLYLANYVEFSVAANKRCLDAVGARDYCLPSAYPAAPDRLLRNDGGLTFTDVTEKAGLLAADGPGLGVAAADFSGDGWPDLYVANDGAPNQLWINRGDGSFEDQGLFSGTAFSAEGLPQGSMGIAAADFDADGDEDIVVTNLPREKSTLYLNQGGGLFRDGTETWGLGTPTAPWTGFGVAWLDYDGDGWLDLFQANGAVTVVEALRGRPRPFQEPNLLLRNPGRPPLRDVSAEGGPPFGLREVGRGVATGDVDDDGDVDVLVCNNDGPPRLLLGAGDPGSGWLRVRLQGTRDAADGTGATVGVVRRGLPTQWRRVHTDGSYLSARDPRVLFGLRGSATVDWVLVRWPSGRREAWPRPGPGRELTLRQGSGRPWPDAVP